MADRQRISWARILGISVVGLAFTAAPFLLASRVNEDFGEEQALLSSTLTNIGTTILLVGIVFFLERGLLQRVSDTAAETTARVVEQRTTDLADANRALATELADLRAQFEGAAEADATERTAPLRTAATDASFDTIAEALETANEFGALQYGSLTIPLVSPSDTPEFVTFDWRHQPVRHADVSRDADSVSPQMLVRYEATRHPGGGPGVPVVEIVWKPEQSPAEMLIALRNKMLQRGFGQEAKLVGPDLFAHAATALADAVAGRQAEEGAWINGALTAWLADGWAITDAGLVSRDHGSILAEEFPPHISPYTTSAPFEPPTPEGVSESFWRFAVKRAQDQHGDYLASPAAFIGATSGTSPAFTRATSPRDGARRRA